MDNRVVVLRYGHRIVRDFRVTSHCALAARAFGAQKIIICGAEDPELTKSVEKISNNWGGKFEVEFADSWKEALKKYKKNGFYAVHLTMYGVPLPSKLKELQKLQKILVIIGSQKVEREVYNLADYNVSVTFQPHSEIAALAIFLDRLFDGAFLSKKFPKSKIFISAREKGKGVLKKME
ncbi:MAG: tRNA (cytidine(56)-2'-O)-methyltransferase [Candidatus Diapherotrites archaeon]|nr:tRNA (cytidine(56)-2'-O)-methyltransferase [Candidatus Diapherotrites archaeon]